jgi:hypothetical protein
MHSEASHGPSSSAALLGRTWSVPLPRALAALATLLSLTALAPPTSARAILLLCLGSIAPLIALRPAWNLAVLLFAAPVVSLPLWSAATWLGWACGWHQILAWWPASLAAVLALSLRSGDRILRLRFEDSDLWALTFVLAFCIPLELVFAASGFQPDGSYTARGWWARDSLYFASLVQMALARHAYPFENPFVAGSPNLYRSASHLAFAGLSEQAHTIAVFAIKPLAFVVLAASSGVVFLATAKHLDRPAAPRLSGLRFVVPLLAALLWMGIRPDLFIFPQTQSVVYAAFVLALLLHEEDSPWGSRLLVASLCVYTAFAHAVTSAVCAGWLAAGGLHALARRRKTGAHFQLGLAVSMGLLFYILNRTPYPSTRIPFAWANAAAAQAYARPWLLPSAAVLLVVASAFRRGLPGLVPLGALALGLAYYGFGVTLAEPSHAWFVAFNAERFLHYALLLAFLLLPLLSRAATVTALALVVAGVVLQPPQLLLSSRELLTMAPDRFTPAELRFFETVRTMTPPEARILSLVPTLALPAFTGRAQAAIEPLDVWSMNALPEGAVALRQTERSSFLELPIAERERIIASRGYTHIVLRPGQDMDVEAYVRHLLPAYQPRLIQEVGGLFLFALDAAPP